MIRYINRYIMILGLVLCVGTVQAQCRLLHGKVSCKGKGLANVMVTDGSICINTNERGEYSFQSVNKDGFVYISIPAGYVTDVEKGTIPLFYKKIEQDQDVYNFELIKNPKEDTRHTFFVHADVQVTALSDLEKYKSIVSDCKQLMRDYCSHDTFGVDCGDIVGDSPFLFPEYINTIKEIGYPVFRAIGNHDMDYYGRSHETSDHTFSNYFGPTHYSYNKGNAHYIIVNNNFYIGRDYFYMGYIDEKTFTWLEQDLANVPKGSLVFLIMHIPGRLKDKQTQFQYNYDLIADQTINFGALSEMMKSYQAHIISGHMHYNLNIEHSPNLIEHNTAAICGTWWRGEICLDGTPQGYAIYEVDGNDVKWYYKGSEYKKEYQFRGYPVGTSAEYPFDIIVNVWNYDPKWKVEWLENGKLMGSLQKYTGFDPDAQILCADKKKVVYDWILPIKNEHMFRAKPQNPKAKIEVRVTDRFGQVYTDVIK